MEKRFLTYTIVLIALIAHGTSIKVHCESQPSTWKPNQRYFINQREVLVPTIYNLSVFVDSLDASVSNMIKNEGHWNPHNLRNIGSTVLNIGSHIGLQAIVIGKALGSKGRIFMFEPFSVSYRLALKNIYCNEIEDIATIYNLGGGSSYSKGILNIDIQNTGASRIFINKTFPGVDPAKLEEVTVDIVDNVLPGDAIVNFALIDSERSELQVLTGLRKTITKSPDIIILCEWSGYFFQTIGEMQKMLSVINWFKQKKFKFYEMAKGVRGCGYAGWIEKTVSFLTDNRYQTDILFVPDHLDPNKIDF